MAFRKAVRAQVTGPPARAFRGWLAPALRRRWRLWTLLIGAAVMAAAGALAGAEVRLGDLELRPGHAPHLRVGPGQGGKAGVTIP